MKFFQKIQGTRPAVIYGLGTLFLLFCTVEQDEARSESIGFSPQTTEYASFSKIKAPQCRGGGAFSAYYLESVLMGKEGGDSLFPRPIPCHLTGMAVWRGENPQCCGDCTGNVWCFRHIYLLLHGNVEQFPIRQLHA